MKKKFKLLLTIASLCFAVAVLTFGVFAATTVTYTAKGTVTYDVNSVFCKIDTQVYLASNVLKSHEADDLPGEDVGTVTWVEVEADLAYDTGVDPNAAEPSAKTLPEIKFNDAVKVSQESEDMKATSFYKIVVTVTLYEQSSNIDITAGDITQSAAEGAKTITNVVNKKVVADDASLTDIACASEVTRTITYYIALDDVTAAAQGDFDITISVAKHAA